MTVLRSRRVLTAGVAATAALMLLSAGFTARASAAPVPQGFVGMMVDGPLSPDASERVDLGHQLDLMVGSGVESLRVVFDWARAQPYADWSEVPASQRRNFVDEAGIPTRFGPLDRVVGLAAQRGLTVLPIVLNSPGWDADQLTPALEANPRSVYWYAQFAEELVQRYGPNGSFWANHAPKVPITMWQIWNEPNLKQFWPVQPFARSYVTMLKAARAAIKAADPAAKIVLAGMPNFSWLDLARIYRIAGARDLFDVVAVHPYTRQPQGVIKIIRYVRGVMNAHGDRRKPILADEVSWPSSAGKTIHDLGLDIATTEAGQAGNLNRLLALLAANRRRLNLAGFYYYTWAGRERPNSVLFNFSGLLRLNAGKFVFKPAFTVFRRDALALEGCRTKTRLATRCG